MESPLLKEVFLVQRCCSDSE